MRKLSKSQKADIESIKYRWEFLRRNQEYVEDWERLQAILEERMELSPLSGKTSRPDPTDCHGLNAIMIVSGIRICVASQRRMLTSEERKFCEKWNISEPVDPGKSYDEYFGHELKELKRALAEGKCDDLATVRNGIDEIDTCSLFWKLRPSQNIPIKELDAYQDSAYELQEPARWHEWYADEKLAKTGKLTIEIDLNYSKSRLIKEFDRLLTWWQYLREEAFCGICYIDEAKAQLGVNSVNPENWHKLLEISKRELERRKSIYRGQRRFDNYDDYLKVYDLREKGKSWSRIQETLNLNGIQMARDYHSAAERLIEEGVPM
jgi:hypothetical protein